MTHRRSMAVVLFAASLLATLSTRARPPEPTPPPTQAAGATCYGGEWWEPGPQGECRFAYTLHLSQSGTSARGTFSWRLVRCPGFEHRLGATGTERVVGTSSATGAHLRGVSVSDDTLLATDEYRLSFEGDRLRGTTRTNEDDWNGRIEGRRTPCPSR